MGQPTEEPVQHCSWPFWLLWEAEQVLEQVRDCLEEAFQEA